MPLDHLQTRATDRGPVLHALLEIEDLDNIISKLVAQRLVVLQREVRDLDLTRLGQCDGTARNVMSLSERNLRSGAVSVCFRRIRPSSLPLFGRGNPPSQWRACPWLGQPASFLDAHSV